MDYLSHNVSENLKRLRQSKGMSLDQVAEQTGVSKVCWRRLKRERQIHHWVCLERLQADCGLNFRL